MSQKQFDAYLEGAEEPYRSQCRKILDECANDWVKLQGAFLSMIDEYLLAEVKKDVNENINAHEAGGHFRIAFPHLFVHRNKDTIKYMEEMIHARRLWTDANLFHGYVDCDEVHHEIETYIYYQMPLYYLGFPGAEQAAKNIVDVAHHIGNWEKDVPPWFNWETSSFVSNWLGTKSVRDYPPYDYQEGNHFRFIDAAICAYRITGEKKYFDLIHNYSSLWCDHIEGLAAKGAVIPCSILPPNAEILERNQAGENLGESAYEIFYSLASDNTMFDIAGALLDFYSISGEERFRRAAETLIDQFVKNGRNGRPAIRYDKGAWLTIGDAGMDSRFVCDSTFIARLALRHHQMTGSDKYRPVIMDWANSIDEENNLYDQMMANVLVAAHYFDGNPEWLARSYRMALRMWANCEHLDDYHQCAWTGKRQGSKFLMEMLYHPMLGDSEWGTRGNIPRVMIRHVTNGEKTLPEEVAFRIWFKAPGIYAYEAVNSGSRAVQWELQHAVEGSLLAKINLGAGERKSGEINF